MFGKVWYILGILVPVCFMARGAYFFIWPKRAIRNATPDKIASGRILGFVLFMGGGVMLAFKLSQ
jgi:hypothetical protein